MIKKGKLFLDPPCEDIDFKRLFRRLAMAGAGRPVDDAGLPSGPWTPELLHEAINDIASVDAGVDLRTVQRWFGDNQHGVRTENIRWLARIFGCDDADAIMRWQVALTASLATLQDNKRLKPNTDMAGQLASAAEQSEVKTEPRKMTSVISRAAAKIFAGHNPLTMPSVLWSGFTVLVFMSYIFNIENVTYLAENQIEKQVGFLRSPSWTIFPVILLPAITFLIGRQLDMLIEDAPHDADHGLVLKFNQAASALNPFSGLIWSVTVVCFFVIFLLQWVGIHLRGLLSGTSHGYMIDWNNIALVRPEIVSVFSEILVSFVAYFYYGIVMWVFLVALIGQVAVSTAVRRGKIVTRSSSSLPISTVKDRLRALVYAVTTLAILSVLTIKLQSTYLITNAESLANWLYLDVAGLFDANIPSFQYLDQKSIPQLTTIILICAVLMSGFLSQNALRHDRSRVGFNDLMRELVSLSLASNVILIGLFPGFSLILALTISISFVELLKCYQVVVSCNGR